MSFQREVELTADRLRSLPEVRLIPAQASFYELLGQMTDRAVPRLAPRAWGDQLVVVSRKVPRDRQEALMPLVRELRRGFDFTV